MSEKVMLIDGNSIVNRGYYALPNLTNSEGLHTGAIYGFLNIMFKFIDEEKPDYIGVAFDLKAPTFRHKAFEGYKGTRKGMPDELREQMPVLKEILQKMGIKIYEKEGFEADDILGTLSKKALDMDILPVVVSGDRDLLQIADKKLKIKIPKTKGGKTEVEEYYESDVIEKYGVTPKQFIDMKALMGDTSDNIPGVPGIGEKTASKIIQEYGDIENAISNAENIKPKKASENLREYQEQARLSKYLATIVRDMDIDFNKDDMRIKDMFTLDAYNIFKRLEFKSFYTRFDSANTGISQEVSSDFLKVLDSESDIEAYVRELDNSKEYSYFMYEEENTIVGFSLYTDESGVVIYGEDNILKCFGDFLTSNEFKKIGNNVKKDIRFLRGKNIELSGISFDTALGAYILNPTRDNYEYNDLASEYLDITYLSEEEIFGKGKSRLSFDKIDKKVLDDFLGRSAKTFFDSAKIIREKMEENGQHTLYYEIELPLMHVLADMEKEGIKVDRQALSDYGNMLSEKIDSITREIYDITGEEFNINSPKQLGIVLFEKMGLKGGKKTKTGYSTSADVLEKLKYESPAVEKVLYYRQLTKLKSTYVDGLLNVIDESTNKIYSTFNQTVTATGRISSTEPNLQNIPVRLDLGRELRKVFIPSDENRCFIDADYSQIELRVLAHISGDETLINAFKNNQDIHRLTASQVFNIPFDEVTPLQRRNAKAVNFGIVYGIGAFSLSQDLGITRKEAENYIQGYFEKYPKIKTYIDETIRSAEEKGYVSTIFGRRRAMPELQSGNFNVRSFGERVAMNMPIQGSAADIIKIAMVKVYNALKEKNMKSKLILQVHDELLIDAYNDEVDEVKEILKTEMENAVHLKTTLDIDMHTGKNWFEAK
ncbi:MAG: DNA polymerase I [Tyzzerella sp.]|uniref:DNA polymerase I n=1 Tax=Candidatus Fimicola merdigallinarum TaxID=2840819 RepID=A0A9D9DXY3_9FIRM|nr:DNA polymerase I [Candidatus Fimicola merdigallinarum]